MYFCLHRRAVCRETAQEVNREFRGTIPLPQNNSVKNYMSHEIEGPEP